MAMCLAVAVLESDHPENILLLLLPDFFTQLSVRVH